MRIGVIACDMIRRELDRLIAEDPDITEVVYLEAALHVYPEKMKAAILEQVEMLGEQVDAIFLGYGYCQSLKGIEALTSVPVVLPQYDDCISILLTPERYAAELKAEVGTWFMTPGWAEVGAEMVIKELKLDRAIRYGKDPMALAKRLFTHYRRGLFVDTGVGDPEEFASYARQFCDDFDLHYEESTAADSGILAEELARCKRLACSKTTIPPARGGRAESSEDTCREAPAASRRPGGPSAAAASLRLRTSER